MPRSRRRLVPASEGISVHDGPLGEGLTAIRQQFAIPSGFAPEVERAAQAAAAGAAGVVDSRDRVDATHLPLTAVDPPGSRDLDQSFHVESLGSGWRLHYCIADVAALVTREDAIGREAWERGVTLYLPDGRSPLHPTVLSEGAASLLAGKRRAALWWTIDFDGGGEQVGVDLRRATVMTRRALSYPQAQALVNEGADEQLRLMSRLGEARQEVERSRGGVSLDLPEQEVRVGSDGVADLVVRSVLPVERWNAQLSLATGMAAAGIMLDAGIGLLRTLPPADDTVLRRLRQASEALGVPWPGGGDGQAAYAAWVASLRVDTPVGLSLVNQAAAALRGAGYAAFDGSRPRSTKHAAVAAPYAHCTAPLRRLGDRYVNEVLVAVTSGREVPAGIRADLPALPEVLDEANRRSATVDRAVVDLVEAAVLAAWVGREIGATVVGRRRGGAEVQLDDPPVVAVVEGCSAPPGDRIRVGVRSVEVTERRVDLGVVG